MENVSCEIDGKLAYVTIANPGKLNALNMAMWNQITQHFTALHQNQDLRCIIIRGADAQFAAGADVQDGIVTIDTDRLYTLVTLPGGTGNHVLTLQFDQPGLQAFAFTFG